MVEGWTTEPATADDAAPDDPPPAPTAATSTATPPISRRAAVKHDLDPHDASAVIGFDAAISCPHSYLPVVTPFKPAAWHRHLAGFHDHAWAHRLVYDLVHGVNIGFRGIRTRRHTTRNLIATAAEHAAVTADLAVEVSLHHIAGPYKTPPFRYYFCSPLKTVPKKGNAAKFRIIHHLSHPHGCSINSDTADWPCPLDGFDHAIRIVRKLGQGCYLAKVDVKAAYRCIPVRPADWPLLGMCWEGQFYFHRTLPFGLRSACHLWERYARAMEWIVRTQFGVEHITHYVDDTFLANSTRALCARDLARTKDGMAALGAPDAPDKTEGPATALTYLGVRIDSAAMSISLDAAKLAAISASLNQWSARSACSLRQLQSLIGTLQWAAYVVRHGRTFLQHLRDLLAQHQDSRALPSDEGAIDITGEARDDIRWWQQYVSQWNGVSLLWDQQWLDRSSTLQPHTDACVEGYAAVCGTAWFHGRWSPAEELAARDDSMGRDSMPWKELFAIVAAASTWGASWQRRKIIFITDCMPVVHALAKGASRTRRIMQLIRALHFYAARFHFVYRAEHIAGVDNAIADELSRVHDVSQLSPACRRCIDPSPVIPSLPAIPA
jgi:hypothetical protein